MNSLSRKVIVVSSLAFIPLVVIVLKNFIYFRKGWNSPELQFEVVFWIIRIILSPLALMYTVRWWTELNKIYRLFFLQALGFTIYSLAHWSMSFIVIKIFLTDFDPRNLNLFNTIKNESILLNLFVYMVSIFIFHAWVYFERYTEEFSKTMLLESQLAKPSTGSISKTQGTPEAKEKLTKVSVKTGGRTTIIPVENIICFHANGPYVKVVTEERTHLINTPLYELQNQLPSSFLRIHRSCIVNTVFIKQTRSLLNGDYALMLGNGLEVRASRTYRESLRSALGTL